jgi:hypothetical protein
VNEGIEEMLRPLLAAVAMHALIPLVPDTGWGPDQLAKASRNYADALLIALKEVTHEAVRAKRAAA